jgi:hypothetical protein
VKQKNPKLEYNSTKVCRSWHARFYCAIAHFQFISWGTKNFVIRFALKTESLFFCNTFCREMPLQFGWSQFCRCRGHFQWIHFLPVLRGHLFRGMVYCQGDQIRFVCPKCGPIHFLWKLLHNSYRKVAQLFGLRLIFHKKTTQSKQSPKRRKFAQSGHPVYCGGGKKSGRGTKNRRDLKQFLGRVTRWACEKIAQNVAKTVFCQN